MGRDDGFTRWVKTLGGDSDADQVVRDMTMNDVGEIYLTGYFTTNITTTDQMADSKGAEDVFISSFSHDGDELWMKSGGGPGTDMGNGICAAATGGVMVGGTYERVATFDPEVLPDDGNESMFVGRLKADCSDAIGGQLTTPDSAIFTGEPAILVLKNYAGNIRWEFSLPGQNNWTLLTASLNDSIQVFPSGSADYRAFVSSPGCASDSSNIVTVQVACQDAVGGKLTASDTVIKAGEVVTLSLTGFSGMVHWETSLPGANNWVPLSADISEVLTISPPVSADYRVVVTADSCRPDTSNVLRILVIDSNANFADAGEDVTICPGDSVQLKASGGDFYKWEPPDYLDTVEVADPWAKPPVSIKYVVHVTRADGITDSDTVVVNVLPRPAVYAGEDVQICLGDQVQLQAEGEGTLRWRPTNQFTDPLLPTQTVSPDTTTTYRAIVTDTSGCRATDRVTVFVFYPPVPYAGEDQILVVEFETQLEATLGRDEKGVWSLESGSGTFLDPGDPNTRVFNMEIGDNVFGWTVTNGICPEVKDRVRIRVRDWLIPSVITPNQDGLNDFFQVAGIGRFPESELVVLNRWGEEVYRSSPYANNWNGIDNAGRELPPDTYYFVLKFTNEEVHKGYVVIIR